MTSVTLVALLLLSAAFLWSKIPRRRVKLDMPYVRFEGDNSFKRYLTDTRTLMKKSYEQYTKKGKPFSMFNQANPVSPIVVLPLRYLEEVRSAPQSKLSFPLSLEKTTMADHFMGPKMTDEAILVVRLHLNRALTKLIPAMQATCSVACAELLPSCDDWTPVVTYQFFLKLFSRITARALVGPVLCNNQEWLDLVIDYLNTVFRAFYFVKAIYPPWLYWAAKYIDSGTRTGFRMRLRAGEILRPELEARKARMKSPLEDEVEGDGIQWLLDAYTAAGKELTPDQLALDEFIITIASIHSSAATALSILYDLLDRPDSLTEVKEEISKVKKEYGSWTRQSLAALKFLDSFMKESQRVHALQQLTMQRMAAVPFTFKDGLHLPAGTQITMPSELIAWDPDMHQDPTAFDPRRFLRQREEIDAARFHFASVSDDMLAFGSGAHACPGRFLAQDVMKLMFVHIFTHYDVKYPAGVESRPADMNRHHNTMPDMKVSLLFKKKTL